MKQSLAPEGFISRRLALPRPAKPSAECAQCQYVERYRGRLTCKWWRCSCAFARDDEAQCGAEGKMFEKRAWL